MNGYGERVSTTNIRGQEMGMVAKGWLERLSVAYDRSAATRARGPRTPDQFKDDPVMKANAEAVEVLLDGNTKQAIESLRAIEAEHPGRYETAANLGTALELSGDVAGALQWITEGVNRNKESHEHSEWIHINILKAKMALKEDPHWLDTHSVSGVNLDKLVERGVIETPQGSMRLYHDALPSVHGSIGWQLSERMSLIKPKDLIVAHLLYELALIEMEIGNLEDAEGELKLAVAYGLPDDLAQAQYNRLAPMMAEIKRAHLIDKMTSGVMPWLVLLLGSVILFYLCRTVYRLVSD